MHNHKSLKLTILVLFLASITIFAGCGGGTTPPLNHPPTINSTEITTAIVGAVYTYDVDATDPDVGDILTYSLTVSPVGMTIDPTTGVINWTPTAAQIGDNDVTVEVSDNGSPVESVSQSFTIIVPYTGSISGIVISDAGGPAVEGSAVTVVGTTLSTTTDAVGNYILSEVPVGTHDVIVTQSGSATSKTQSVIIIKDQTTSVDFIQKEVNVPGWEINPPTISTTGIAEGDILTGLITCSVQVTDDSDIKCIYIGFDYVPGELEYDFASFDNNEIAPGPIDTTYIPDGEYEIVIVAYDMNYNRSQLTLNVTINNGGFGTAPTTPTSLWPLSITLGENVGFFSLGRNELFERIGINENPNIINLSEGRKIDLNAVIDVADPDSNLFIEIEWDDVVDATGYKIYRKFESESNYQCIGSNGDPWFCDTDPRLSVGRKTYYQVSAYNGFGESEKTSAEWTIPLPKFNLNLLSPADGAIGVSLTPTLQWQLIDLVGNYQEYYFYVIGKNDGYYTWDSWTLNATSVIYNGDPLQYLKVYEWNVWSAIAYDDFYSTWPLFRAVSIAGDGSGSLNGAFEFTTQSE